MASSVSVSKPAFCSTARNASQSVGSSRRRPRRSFSASVSPRNRRTKDGILGAGEELDLAELHRLEPARRRQPVPELAEVLRRHGLEDVDLLGQHAFDGVHAAEQMLGQPELTGQHRVPGRGQLVQDLLEPQLVHLVNRDEQQLVVRRRIRLQPLLIEQLGQPQITAVRQPPTGLPEVDVDPVPPPRNPVLCAHGPESNRRVRDRSVIRSLDLGYAETRSCMSATVRTPLVPGGPTREEPRSRRCCSTTIRPWFTWRI